MTRRGMIFVVSVVVQAISVEQTESLLKAGMSNFPNLPKHPQEDFLLAVAVIAVIFVIGTLYIFNK